MPLNGFSITVYDMIITLLLVKLALYVHKLSNY